MRLGIATGKRQQNVAHQRALAATGIAEDNEQRLFADDSVNRTGGARVILGTSGHRHINLFEAQAGSGLNLEAAKIEAAETLNDKSPIVRVEQRQIRLGQRRGEMEVAVNDGLLNVSNGGPIRGDDRLGGRFRERVRQGAHWFLPVTGRLSPNRELRMSSA